MSVRLTVKQRSQQGSGEKPQVVLLDDAVINFGREQTCQVVLAQQAVSRNHARISRDGSLFFLEDLGSAYGTQINGSKLPKGEKHLLRNGDVIAIAQFDVTFDRVANPEESGKTAFVARKVVKDVMRGLGAGGEQPYMRFMNGVREGQRIEIPDANELVIGREPGVDLLFEEDDLISRRHCKIRRDWSGTHVEDLDSRNGIKVNKKRVRKKTLKDRDELEVGAVRLLYIDPTEVRETPVVLPSEEDEKTGALAPGDSGPAGSDPDEDSAAKARSARPEPEPEPEAPASEPEPVSDPGEGPASDAGISSMTDESGPPSLSGPVPEVPSQEHDLGDRVSRVGLDITNRSTQVVLGLAGLVALIAVIFVILVFAA